MSVLEEIYREVCVCEISDIDRRLPEWINRCRANNISVFALEKVIATALLAKKLDNERVGTRFAYYSEVDDDIQDVVSEKSNSFFDSAVKIFKMFIK